MSGGIETVTVIDSWLYSKLSTDSALSELVGDRLIGTLAGGNVVTPYVVWFLSSARDISTVPTIRVQVDALYTVKAVGEGSSWDEVQAVASRVDALLHGANDTTATGSVACVRESIVQYAEVDSGTQYRHLGGIFRVRANSL